MIFFRIWGLMMGKGLVLGLFAGAALGATLAPRNRYYYGGYPYGGYGFGGYNRYGYYGPGYTYNSYDYRPRTRRHYHNTTVVVQQSPSSYQQPNPVPSAPLVSNPMTSNTVLTDPPVKETSHTTQGINAYDQYKLDEAREHFRYVIGHTSKSANADTARYFLGEIALQQKRPAQAKKWFEKLRDRTSVQENKDTANHCLAKLSLDNGILGDTVEYLSKLPEGYNADGYEADLKKLYIQLNNDLHKSYYLVDAKPPASMSHDEVRDELQNLTQMVELYTKAKQLFDASTLCDDATHINCAQVIQNKNFEIYARIQALLIRAAKIESERLRKPTGCFTWGKITKADNIDRAASALSTEHSATNETNLLRELYRNRNPISPFNAKSWEIVPDVMKENFKKGPKK
jgi:hypothetical protein